MILFHRNISASGASRRLMMALMAGWALSAAAVTVEIEPGGLRDAVASPLTETSLTVKGAMDITDFDFIREMPALKQLDLSQASVAPYSGEATATGVTSSPADALPDCALLSVPATEVKLPASLKQIGSGALGNLNVEALQIPETVTTIGSGALANMSKLREITIPKSVTVLPEMLLKDSPLLEKVTILGNVAEIPASAFRNCPRLAQVALPASLTSIGEYAFAGCKSLASLTLPASLRSIGNSAFAGSGLTEIALPAALTAIGDWSFAGCSALKSVEIGGDLVKIGVGAFYSDPSLAISLGDIAANTTEIPDYLLYGAKSASSAGLGNTAVESIGNYALSGMTDNSITLPSTLNYLGDNAMERWVNLTEIDANAISEVPALGSSVWEDVDQPGAIVYVPQNLVDRYQDTPQWKEFKIMGYSITSTPALDDDAASHLRAAFDGQTLLLESDIEIRAVQLYDIAGRCFTIATNPEGYRMQIDTAPYDTSVFLLRVILADSTTATLKLHRP